MGLFGLLLLSILFFSQRITPQTSSHPRPSRFVSNSPIGGGGSVVRERAKGLGRLAINAKANPGSQKDKWNQLVLSQPRNRKGLEAKGRTDGLGPSLRKSVWVIVIWRLTEY